MLAGCCKPSSVAGVVWMEITFEGPGSTPGLEEWRSPQGDPTMQQLYQGTEEKSEECKTKELLVQL